MTDLLETFTSMSKTEWAEVQRHMRWVYRLDCYNPRPIPREMLTYFRDPPTVAEWNTLRGQVAAARMASDEEARRIRQNQSVIQRREYQRAYMYKRRHRADGSASPTTPAQRED